MYKNNRVLAIIPARGGSKGLPKKNIKEILGMPLIAWTIKQAQNCEYIDKIYVSTDSKEIASVSEEYGVNIPKLRPKHLAEDTSSSVDLVNYIIEDLETEGEVFDYIVLLEPTSPMRRRGDIGNALELAINHSDADGVISVGAVHMEHPTTVKRVQSDGYITSYLQSKREIVQRQQLEDVYFPYGVAYIIKTEVFLEKHAFYTDKILPYYIERWQNYEVDDIYDFLCIESIMKEKRSELL